MDYSMSNVNAQVDMNEFIKALQSENKRLRGDNVRMAEKIRKIESGNFDEYFIYTPDSVTLTADGTATLTLSITREADFYLTKIIRVSTGAFSALIRDASNDRQWSNQAVHSDIFAGTAQLPAILPKPRFIARSSTLTINLTDLSSSSNTVYLGFVGYKVYHIEDLRATSP